MNDFNALVERAKLRRIANEMREQIATRHRLISLHGVRGFRCLKGAGEIAGAFDLDGDNGPQTPKSLHMDPGQGIEPTPQQDMGGN